MQLTILLSIKVVIAIGVAQSMRWSFHSWKETRVLHHIEPISRHPFVDDLKMASAVTIAAAVMIPAILAFALVSWLIRSLSRLPDRANRTLQALALNPVTRARWIEGAPIDVRARDRRDGRIDA